MKKKDLSKIINQLDGHIDVYQFAVGIYTKASFILGCYYNEKVKEWKIYENDERGIQSVVFKAETEEAAYEKLSILINFYKRLKKIY